MNTKTKNSALFAAASLAVLLTALFVPLFFGIGYMCVVTASVWEFSHIIALLCAATISGIILLPFIRPSANSWFLPFSFGLAIFASALCAAVYTFSVADRFNFYFNPYGLILLAVGALLCIIEGFTAKSQSHSNNDA
jgi:hypothetical protein